MAQAWCFSQGIDPNLVASRQEISDFHRQFSRSESCENLPLFQGWRREALGDILMDILTSKKSIGLACGDHRFTGRLFSGTLMPTPLIDPTSSARTDK